MQADHSTWYLVRTRQYKEVAVRDTLAKLIADTYLPLLRTRQKQWGRLASRIVPLFPCYLFARLDLHSGYYRVQRIPGVVDLVSAGGEPLEVDEYIIAEIKKRATNGIVELPQETLRTGDVVEIIDGPLRGLSGVCERYLSGPERVTLLVTLIGATNVRVVAPTRIVARSRDDLRRVADGQR